MAFVFEDFDVVFTLKAFLVDLVLFGADEGAFIDVGMDFDVGVVAELEIVLDCCLAVCVSLELIRAPWWLTHLL